MDKSVKAKSTLLTLKLSTKTTLLGFIIAILTSSFGFFPSHTPAFGQEDDLGNFSIVNTTELTSGSNTSQVYVIPEQGEEAGSPPSSEAPRSEAPQSEAPQSEP